MLQEAAPTRFYRFGEYEVDSAKRFLLLNGRRIPLTPKAFDVLLALVERHGEIVSKNELLRTVWPNTVVEEIGLTRNISVLRKALGEKPDEHTYIVTVPGTGYRFVAPVERADTPASPASPESRARRLWPWITAAALVAVVGFLTWYARSESTPRVWRSVPLTSYPGFESNPALSPEGNRVAFTWDGDKQDNFDIYVQSIGAGAPLRLTTNPAEDVSPAWSPDGSTIAFLRRLGGGGHTILLIPVLGGPERKLADIRGEARRPLSSLAWSPDGRWLAVPHREPDDLAEGLFLVSTLTGDKRRLTAAPRGSSGDSEPAFSPDGRSLAFMRLSTVHLLPLLRDFQAAAEPRRLATGGLWATSPVWTRDGRHILYVFSEAHREAPHKLGIMAVSGSRRVERAPLLEDDISQLSFGRHLVYSREPEDTNIWRVEIRPPGVPSGAPQRFISSTRRDGLARYSPDGKRIAFGSTRSGTREIWIAEADGSNPVQLTSFGGPLVGVLNWSPDSQRLVFHARPQGQADLFTIAAAGGTPQRLTTDPSDDGTPGYSHDGRWIYFSSRRSGQPEIWKMPVEGGDATQMTRTGGYLPSESPDGKTLYYCHASPEKGIWKVPVAGGEAVQVTGPVRWMCGLAVTTEGLYYTAAPDAHNRHSIEFLSFSTGKTRPVVVSDRPVGSLALSVSPDERFVLYTQFDQSGSDLMLIENFAGR